MRTEARRNEALPSPAVTEGLEATVKARRKEWLMSVGPQSLQSKKSEPPHASLGATAPTTPRSPPIWKRVVFGEGGGGFCGPSMRVENAGGASTELLGGG